MRLPEPRGPLSALVLRQLSSEAGVDSAAATALIESCSPSCDLLTDDDFQITLWALYELAYRGFDEVDPDAEWDPELLRVRQALERRFEEELRMRTAGHVERALQGEDLPTQLTRLIDAMEGPRLTSFLQREASTEQVLDYLMQRSLYHLKESDPHSFVLPRIDGRAKVALAELQYDEYGAGRPHRLHATLFGDALEGCGLDRRYGAYVDQIPGHTLAVNNVMSLFGLHRRLRGASMGHLAAFECTSSVPCRRIAAGIERVGLPDVVAEYFYEHVEADAAHEQIAVRDICAALVDDEPDLREDVLFVAAACLYLDAIAATHLLAAWTDQSNRSAEVAGVAS
jgi:pyrroloquinoline quinone (PQQ) biosynthesis protein C